MTRELHELIDLEGLTASERERLERVHTMLSEAGPPDELPARLSVPSDGHRGGAQVIALRRRRPAAALLVAASIAAVCFGSGYVIANEAHSGSAGAVEVISLQGSQQDSFAALRVGAADPGGNQPLELTVRGLPPLTNPRMRYALVMSHGGRPSSVIGMFSVGSHGATAVTFSVPFSVTAGMRFEVTEATVTGRQLPGHVVMTNS